MKRIMILLLTFTLAASVFQTRTTAATDVCVPYKGVKKIWWGELELKKGQIGRLTVLKDTALFAVKGNKQVFSRMLKAKEKYRIYTFNTGMVGLGGSYYVNRDNKVLYETPSKQKLLALSCVSFGTPGPPEAPYTGDSGLTPLQASNIPEVNALIQEVNSLSSTLYKISPQQIEQQAKSIQAKLDVLKYTQPIAIEPVVKRLQELNQKSLILYKNKLPNQLHMQDMILDESRGYLYFLDSGDDKLYVYSTKDGKKVKEVPVSNGRSMELYNGKLYIIAYDHPITIFDPATFTTKLEYYLPNMSFFVIHNDHIYYSTYNHNDNVYDYDLKTKYISPIAKKDQPKEYQFYAPRLAIDPGRDILYVKDTDSKSTKVIDLKTNNILRTDTIVDVGKFTNNSFFWDDGNIISDGYKVDPSDFTNILGFYSGDELFNRPVKGNYLFGHKYIFDRNTFLPIRTMPQDYDVFDMMVMDSSNNIYSYHNGFLSKFKMIIIPVKLPSFEQTYHQLIFEKEITKWVYDETSNQIFAISEKANKLYYISPDTMSVKREVFIGSAPTDLELYHGCLYIALKGTHRIAVADTDPDKPISFIKVNVMPDTIEVGKNKIFYQHTDQFNPIYAYDMTDGSTTDILRKMFPTTHPIYGPKLKYDADANVLYIDTHSSQKIYAVDADTYKIKQMSDYIKFYRNGEILLDGNTLYHGFYYSPKDDLTQMKVDADLPVLYVGKDYLFTADGYYDKGTMTKQTTFTNKLNSVFMNDRNEVLTLDEKQTTLMKYEDVKDIK